MPGAILSIISCGNRSVRGLRKRNGDDQNSVGHPHFFENIKLVNKLCRSVLSVYWDS